MALGWTSTPRRVDEVVELLTTSRRCRPYNVEVAFRWLGVAPIRSRTSAASSINILMLDDKLELFPSVIVLRYSAKQAENEIIMTVLFGIDFSWLSPWTAARITFNEAESPAARKNRVTSTGAVGRLMTVLYVESLV